ncbi:hypothetical protein [Streptococcus pluranimalium]|uniref:hypothetical protein n=1 Tax=Streptococcus pluranimalium TaxID=82348 RepID=UPI0039FD45E5
MDSKAMFIFQEIIEGQLIDIKAGASYHNYPAPWYAKSNTPPSGYYDMWDVYQPWKPIRIGF